MSHQREVVKARPDRPCGWVRLPTHLTTTSEGRRLLIDSRFPRRLWICFRREDPCRAARGIARASPRVLDQGSDRGKEVKGARKISTISRGEAAKGRGAQGQKRAEAEKETGEEGQRSADRGDRTRRARSRTRLPSCRKSPPSPYFITGVGRVCQSLGTFARSRPHRSRLFVQVRLTTAQTPASGSW